jgi:hypothetical protein
MERFFRATEEEYRALERRASRACVVFANCQLPPGATPPRARVGVEVRHIDGRIALLVERVTYSGNEGSVADWLRRGERVFADVGELRTWVCGDLRRAYPERAPQRPLIDLAAVRAHVAAALPPPVDADELLQSLQAAVRGQDDALRTLARRVAHHLSRRQPRRPLSIFAVGSTGVGKTATAETLAPTLARLTAPEVATRYLRLDMSEYQERHRVSQLLGAPPGYIGYEQGAPLLEALAAAPRAVVLFDEIDKAHPDVLRTLMNAMDAGRLSGGSATARTVDCRGAIFVFTSNLDATGVLLELDARDAFDQPRVVDEVCRAHLLTHGVAPELVGRVGAFLAYRDLNQDTRAEIVVLAIQSVAAEYGLEVAEVDPLLIAELLSASPPGLGARPSQYLVDDVLGGVLAGAARSSVNRITLGAGSPPRWRAAP